NGTCSITTSLSCVSGGGTFLGNTVAACPSGRCFAETEPNDSRFSPNGPFAMAVGDMIVGNTTGTSGTALDYFTVTPPAASLGVYPNTLVLTSSGEAAGASGHSPISRGITQIDGVADYRNAPITEDANGQTVSASAAGATPPRTLVWYDFGAS